MTSMIRLWKEEDEDHMLNERDEEGWCSWNKNGKILKIKMKKIIEKVKLLSFHQEVR